MKKIEIISWTSILLLILYKTLFDLSFIVFLVILLITMVLAAIYSILSFFILNSVPLKSFRLRIRYEDISPARTLGSISLGFVYSMFVVAIVFFSLDFPGATILLRMSSFFILISLILAFDRLKKHQGSIFYKEIIRRDVSFLIVGALFIVISFLPNETRVKIFPYPEFKIKTK